MTIGLSGLKKKKTWDKYIKGKKYDKYNSGQTWKTTKSKIHHKTWKYNKSKT